VKIESLFLIGVGVFFGIIGLLYWFWAADIYHLPEEAGFLMLIGATLLGVVPGLFYLFWHQRFKGRRVFLWGKLDRVAGMRPEDRPDATIEEGAGTISSFPNSSIWPFVLGGGAFLIVNGLVFGWWIAIPGLILAVIAAIGATAESRRGGHV
jgi:Cytochrome c oxidase subunit IV